MNNHANNKIVVENAGDWGLKKFSIETDSKSNKNLKNYKGEITVFIFH